LADLNAATRPSLQYLGGRLLAFGVLWSKRDRPSKILALNHERAAVHVQDLQDSLAEAHVTSARTYFSQRTVLFAVLDFGAVVFEFRRSAS